MQEVVRDDVTKYYEYKLQYVYNCIAIRLNPEKILRDEIGKIFKLKESSIGLPGQYLGGNLHKVLLENGIECWAFSLSQYIQEAVKYITTYLPELKKKKKN